MDMWADVFYFLILVSFFSLCLLFAEACERF